MKVATSDIIQKCCLIGVGKEMKGISTSERIVIYGKVLAAIGKYINFQF